MGVQSQWSRAVLEIAQTRRGHAVACASKQEACINCLYYGYE